MLYILGLAIAHKVIQELLNEYDAKSQTKYKSSLNQKILAYKFFQLKINNLKWFTYKINL